MWIGELWAQMTITDAPALPTAYYGHRARGSTLGDVHIAVVLQPLGSSLVYSCLCQPTTWVELSSSERSDVKVELSQVKVVRKTPNLQ